MRPLFDEVPVTQQDIEAWLDTIPNLSRSEFRRKAYRQAYRIEEKLLRLPDAGHRKANPMSFDDRDYIYHPKEFRGTKEHFKSIPPQFNYREAALKWVILFATAWIIYAAYKLI